MVQVLYWVILLLQYLIKQIFNSCSLLLDGLYIERTIEEAQNWHYRDTFEDWFFQLKVERPIETSMVGQCGGGPEKD